MRFLPLFILALFAVSAIASEVTQNFGEFQKRRDLQQCLDLDHKCYPDLPPIYNGLCCELWECREYNHTPPPILWTCQ